MQHQKEDISCWYWALMLCRLSGLGSTTVLVQKHGDPRFSRGSLQISTTRLIRKHELVCILSDLFTARRQGELYQ